MTHGRTNAAFAVIMIGEASHESDKGAELKDSLKEFVKSSEVFSIALAGPLALRRQFLKRRYASAFEAMRRLSGLARGDVTIDVPEFSGQFQISPRSAIFQRYIVYGYYEPDISAMFLSQVDPSRDVIDVGANIGFYTIGAAKRLSAGRVLSVEPTVGAFSRLKINVAQNGAQDLVILEKCLIADEPGELEINVLDGQEEYSSMSGIIHPGAAGQESVTERVRAVTLDSLVSAHNLKPSIIKIDVEGAEMAVLRGAINVLREYSPAVMAECSDALLREQGTSSAEMINLLDSLGYDAINPRAPRIKLGKRIEGDVFFFKRGSLAF